ncbi:MAG: ABC transporter ATP-binding protein [Phycisphaeraceae bacterium]|nr:ABC transporter ATP-binding protein [Phycisphaeraceae bacterium]
MNLVIRDLRVRRGHFTLGPLSAGVGPGRVVAVLGGNGCGKSTLLGAIAGSIPVDRGELRHDGVDLRRLPPMARAKRLAFVPQRPGLDAAFTVRACVELGRFALPENPRRVNEAIERCGLASLAWRRWHDLSEGQRQRVAIARAMAQHEPGGLLLLDEPFAAMDPASARSAFEVIRDAAKAGASVLLATHDLVLAAATDEVWLVRDGALVAAGETERVLVPDVLETVYGVRFTMVEGVAPRPAPLPKWLPGTTPNAPSA